MDALILKKMIGEIHNQCEFALIAETDLRNALQRQDMSRFWYSMQSLLVAIGNLSKLLWTADKKEANKRKRHLRDSRWDLRRVFPAKLGRKFKNRDIRNAFEHFDERIERWYNKSRNQNFIDRNIASPRMLIRKARKSDCHRNFDPQKFEVTFQGITDKLNPILQAIREMDSVASSYRVR